MNLAIEKKQILFEFNISLSIIAFTAFFLHLPNFIGECFNSDIHVYKYYYYKR